MLMSVRAVSIFQVARKLKARYARSHAHALLSPGSQMAHACARPPAGLPDERLSELIEQAQRWVQWVETERARRVAMQTEAAAPSVQPP